MEGHDTSLQIAPNALKGGNRHICAFFHGMEEEYRVLQSFITDGFDKGDKAFHLVDPKRREDHLRRLADAGIDVEEVMASGQLEAPGRRAKAPKPAFPAWAVFELRRSRKPSICP